MQSRKYHETFDEIQEIEKKGKEELEAKIKEYADNGWLRTSTVEIKQKLQQELDEIKARTGVSKKRKVDELLSKAIKEEKARLDKLEVGDEEC